ncbi:MAG: MarR family transcriptional regulator [Actinomycetota bacterium]|nr:MarR family transcriptional regulator [Actinomycetota bacterium]
MSVKAKKEAERRHAAEKLRQAATQMFGAERRLRSRDHSRAGELTQAQLRALATIGREQAMTAGQLAKSADLNPATVTAMLDQLEELKVVQRHRSTEDRRVCNVSLTPEGWQLLERKRAYWDSLWDEHLSQFSDHDLEAAAAVIEEVTAIYDGLAARLEPGR